MLKGLLRRFFFYTIALYITTLLLAGVNVHGSTQTYLVVGIVLTLMMLIIRPILQIISIPINFITFGLFSFLINAIILFLLTIFMSQFTISAFVFPHVEFFGFATPAIPLNSWFAFLVASLLISGIYSFLTWLMTE